MSLTYTFDSPNANEATVSGHSTGSSYSGTITIPHTVDANGIAVSQGSGYTVRAIGDDAFYDYANLSEVTLPAGLNIIGKNAFSTCTSLTSLVIPSEVHTIDNSAFTSCTALTSVTFNGTVGTPGTAGSALQNIGSAAFSYCSNLLSIIIPPLVENIGNYAFMYCPELEYVAFTHNSSQASNITFGDLVFYQSNTTKKLILVNDNINLKGNLYTIDMASPPNLSNGIFSEVISASNICFPAGTVLSLDQGDVEIQNVDTKKHTLDGKPILFVTKTAPNKPDVVCFEKDAFAPNVPSQRFECSRAHGIEFEGVRKMAEDWVNADQIHFVPNTHKFLYCLLLETHEMMDVYNIRAETLNPVRKVAQMYFAQLKKEKESC